MQNSPPLVTIGLPVYNGEPYFRAALESLLAQDYPDFDIVVVDNSRSSEGHGLVDRIVADRDDPARRQRQAREDRPGISFARNRGLAEATGEIVAFVDELNGGIAPADPDPDDDSEPPQAASATAPATSAVAIRALAPISPPRFWLDSLTRWTLAPP